MRSRGTKSKLVFRVSFWRGGLIAALATTGIAPLLAGSSTESSNQIDQVRREAVKDGKLPGVAAMVAVGDQVVYQGASGNRDTVKNISMTLDSIFRIASMTKPITAVAVMQLVESGRSGLPKLRPLSGNCFPTYPATSTSLSIKSCPTMRPAELSPHSLRETTASSRRHSCLIPACRASRN